MIDIVDEMAKKLNFTYVLHLAQASMALNSSEDVNGTVRRKKKPHANRKHFHFSRCPRKFIS
jgi:hypothetical protein